MPSWACAQSISYSFRNRAMKADVLTHAFERADAPWSVRLPLLFLRGSARNLHVFVASTRTRPDSALFRNSHETLHPAHLFSQGLRKRANKGVLFVVSTKSGTLRRALRECHEIAQPTATFSVFLRKHDPVNDTGLKLRLTLYAAEFGLEKIYSHLAHLPNENIRARAIKGMLPFVLEIGRIPDWFSTIPQQQTDLPRSMTIRVSLPGNDPTFALVNARLRELGESARAAWIKNLLARSQGLKTDLAPSAGLTPSPSTAASPSPIPPTATASTSSSDLTPESAISTATPVDDQVRKKAHQKALRAFDIAQLNSTNH